MVNVTRFVPYSRVDQLHQPLSNYFCIFTHFIALEMSEIKNKIIDDNTITANYVLGGKEVPEEAKQLLPEVIKYYFERNLVSPSTETQKNVIKTVQSLPEITYESLYTAFGADSFDTLLAYLLIGFMTQTYEDPLKQFTYTYGRTPPLKADKEWLDNFRINNLGQPLNMLVWRKFDTNNNYSVHIHSSQPINESAQINYKKVYELLVTPLRGIILHKLHNIAYDNYKEMCDACYNRFAYCYCGAHGCDVFDTPMSLTVMELREVLNRYTSWCIGYVLNTATYASHSGVHWVAFELINQSALLICSQASGFECFQDGGKLFNTLPKFGFTLQNNDAIVQYDKYNCGVFSPIALWALLQYDNNILNAVNEGIGKNGVKIHGASLFAKDINQVRENIFLQK